jgi:Protein of unknown function (DUF2281)
MVQVEEQIIEAVRTLPPAKQQEVLDFAEFLHAKLPAPQTESKEANESVSALEVAGDLVGCLEGGPPDLSVNKKYLEGFGNS